ncbi:MAG: DMT family transporter [Planctomycetes bacterium]|nr:DMT family transporter [Planctomycetota bacterium]
MKLSPRFTLLVYVLAVGWASPLFRLANAPPLLAGGARIAIATLLLAPFSMGALRPAFADRRLLGKVLFAGLLLAAHFALWIPALSLTSIAASTVLVSMQPLFSAVLERLAFGARVAPRVALGAGAALAGTGVIAAGDLGQGDWLSSRALLGDLLSLAGAATAAAYFVLGRGARKQMPIGGYLLLVNATAAAALLAASAVRGEPWFAAGPGPAPDGWQGIDGSAFCWFLLLAVVPQLLGHGMANLTVRHYPVVVVNVAGLAEPILSSALVWWIFGDSVPASVWMGAPLVLAGMAAALTAPQPAGDAAGAE